MQSAMQILVNGTAGVFAGMAVLYLTIKLIALLPEKKQDKKEA